MKTIAIIVFALVACACFVSSAPAQSVQKCTDKYLQDVMAAVGNIQTFQSEFCPILTNYMKCLVSYYESIGITWTPFMTNLFENIMEQQIRKVGFSCDLDINAIINKR